MIIRGCALALAMLFVSWLQVVNAAVDGGMSGGGGGTLPGSPIGLDLFDEILPRSRAELVFFFNKQSSNPSSPELARLLQAHPNIQDVIESTPIYSSMGSYHCKDGAGSPVDGSIHSPVPNTICISGWSLASSLSREEAHNQILSLAAHEYSHLLGFNESEAQTLQKQIVQRLGQASIAQIDEMKRRHRDAFWMIRGAILNYRADAGTKNWNQACFLADKLVRHFSSLKTHGALAEFQFFDRPAYERHLSHFMKASALQRGSCSQSDFHPDREAYKLVYAKWFGQRKTIAADEVAQTLISNRVDASVQLRRIDTLTDFEAELEDLLAHANEGDDRVSQLDALYDFHSKHPLQGLY